MNEEKQFLNNEEAIPVEGDAQEVQLPAFTAEYNPELSGPSQYDAEQHVEVNNEVVPAEAFEFSPEMITEWEMLNPEEKEASVELVQEAVLVANISETGNESAERSAKISSLSTAFALTEPGAGEVEGDALEQEDLPEKMSFAKRMLNAVYETAGKGARAAAVAATMGIAMLAPMKSAEAGNYLSPLQQTIKQIDRGIRGAQEVQSTRHQQERLQMNIEKLEQQKLDLIRQTDARSRLEESKNNTQTAVGEKREAANYKMEKAQLQMEYARVKENFLKQHPNPSEADQALYEASLAKLDAKEAQIDARHEINRLNEGVRHDATDERINYNEDATARRIQEIDMRISDLRLQIQRLNMKTPQQVIKTIDDIGRYK